MNKSELARQITDSAIKIDLGQDGVDDVTGFAGECTAIILYDKASPQVCLEAIVNGKRKREWFDAARVS